MAYNSHADSSFLDLSLVWRGAEIPGRYLDITGEVEVNNLDIMNYDSGFGTPKSLFEKTCPSALVTGRGNKEDNSIKPDFDWIQSDVDAQLMMLIPFQSAVDIHSIQITSLPPSTSDDESDSRNEELSRPGEIRLYANLYPNLSFDATDDIPSTQTFTLGPDDWNDETGTAQLELRFVKFQKVTSLVLFIVDGGESEKVRLDRVRIIGRPGTKRETGKLQKSGPAMAKYRVSVICLNEEEFGIRSLENRTDSTDSQLSAIRGETTSASYEDPKDSTLKDSKRQSQTRLPEDGTTFTYSGNFINTRQEFVSGSRIRDIHSMRFQKGDLVFSTSPGDIDAIKDAEVRLPMGEVRLALASGNAGLGENPYLRIRVGGLHQSKLSIHPVKDTLGDVLAECSKTEDVYTSSDASFKLAAAWFEECRSSHKFCSQYQGPIPELPSRVIDVGSLESSEDPTAVTLYVPDKGETGQYLALSHRWGNSKSLDETKTKEKNYACNVKEVKRPRTISFAELPLTFQHAITITRKLRYQYLWIDSLCIIQDNKKDWEQESRRMAEIYRRADLTIASIDAEGGDSGCFFPRDGQSVKPCLLDIKRPPVQMDTYGRKPGKIFAFPSTRFDYLRANYRRHSSLDTREWCLQERALSTRVLSYGKDGLYWECVTVDATEQVPEGIEHSSKSGDNEYMHALRKQAAEITEIDHYQGFKNAHHAWHLLAQDYSRRDLTNEEDKLMALAGIVENLSGPKEDICHAGIWEKCLWRDLMWLDFTKDTILKRFLDSSGTVPPVGPPGRRLSGTIAPSWSWMSVHGHVCFQATEYRDLKSYNVYSEFSFGESAPEIDPHPTVVATGVLVQARTCTCDGRCDTQYAKSVEEDAVHYPQEGKIQHLLDAGTGERVADCFPDVENEISGVVFCIPVAEIWGDVHCLVLVPADNEDVKSTYRRVGLALWSRSKWVGPVSDHLLKRPEEQTSLIPQDEVKSVDETGNFQAVSTIRII